MQTPQAVGESADSAMDTSTDNLAASSENLGVSTDSLSMSTSQLSLGLASPAPQRAPEVRRGYFCFCFAGEKTLGLRLCACLLHQMDLGSNKREVSRRIL
jgi:hypothetical protein